MERTKSILIETIAMVLYNHHCRKIPGQIGFLAWDKLKQYNATLAAIYVRDANDIATFLIDNNWVEVQESINGPDGNNQTASHGAGGG